jgi:uncharacterized protein (DUF1015 family)
MITIKPFKAIRPTRDKAYLLASRSYVSYTDEELADKLNNNPYTFLHIINPDYHDKQHSQGLERYKKVRQRYADFKQYGYFIEEEKPAYYIYQQQAEHHVFTGIIAATSVNDYVNGKIKVHENTLTSREEMFTDYLETAGFNAEPVLLIHPSISALAQVKNKYMDHRPEYEFTSTDRVLHLLWPILDAEDIDLISNAFKGVDALYIADGHHRSASSKCLAERRGLEKEGPHQYFMSYLLSENNVRIHAFNRLLKDLNGLSEEQLIEQISASFFVREITDHHYKPESLHEFSMYAHGRWYALFCRPGSYDAEDAVGSLDCQILSDNVLNPVFGIQDLRTDARIDFLPGDTGAKGIMEAVNSGKYAVGFGLYPVTINQIKRVSDEGSIMPPKSTYIEPKLRSGLTIYNLEET